MRHFPIFIALRGRRVVVSGAGETAEAKLRLLLKTEARIAVYGADPTPQLRRWAEAGALTLLARPIARGDALCAALLYAANDDAEEDARAAELGRAAGALVNIVDNLQDSAFITPALVDRDPVTVAIGTEGAAPVLARRIKALIEERLPAELGALARIGQSFRGRAEALPPGRARRDFWAGFYEGAGLQAYRAGGEAAARAVLESLLTEALSAPAPPGRVTVVGTGCGDPELLTVKARRAIDEADLVIHERAAPAAILELIRREARRRLAGEDAVDLAREAADGARIVRLTAGDVSSAALAAELPTLIDAGIPVEILPGAPAPRPAALFTSKAVGE